MAPEFVTAAGTSFALGGQPFRASGVNCYFLAYCSDASRREVLRTAREMGANVIRSWAFLDRAAPAPGQVAFQCAENGVIVQNTGPDGLERLDAFIAAAEELGFYLILPFVNYWDDFGGIPQYLDWLGIEGGPTQFYADPRARDAYRRWVQTLLARRNSRTGRFYSEEPSILAWELANEPRCEIPGGRKLLLDWIGDMSAFVKSIDRNHLLAAGDEGYFLKPEDPTDHLYNGSYGVDCEAILNLGTIDFGTYHFYPDSMGRRPAFAETWIRDHIALGGRVNKPMLLAEYGLLAYGKLIRTTARRRRWYARWRQSIDDAGGAGDLLWMLGGSGTDVAGFHDRYTVYDPYEVPPLNVAPRISS